MRYGTLLTLSSTLSLLGACGSSSDPDSLAFAGDYDASVMIVTAAGLHPVDLLAGGSSLTISIAGDSSVTGHLFIPAAITGTGDLDDDLAGTASATVSTISFDQTADTFVRDLTFTRHRDYLSADQMINGDRYVVRLDL